jgi:hypothetical protein
MSKVISVLEKMASDAAMNSEKAIDDLVTISDINDGQMQAIKANDVEGLVESTTNLPTVKCFMVIPAEDEEEEEEDEESTNDTDSISELASVVSF